MIKRRCSLGIWIIPTQTHTDTKVTLFLISGSQLQNAHLPLLPFLGRVTVTENTKAVLWVGLHRFFSECGKYKTWLQCHRSIQLSARLWYMYWDHQYSADDFRDIQNLAGKVPEQPDLTGPALCRCWTTWPLWVPPNLHDYNWTTLYSLLSFISSGIQCSSLNDPFLLWWTPA